MKKYIIFCLLLASFPASILFAQNRQISGTVRDENGPVPAATIIEKGVSNNATSTDANGKFTITLKGSANALLVSATGYLPAEADAAGSLLTINLVIDTKGLGEVVVVGYGKQKKITLTGSVSSVSGPVLRQNPSASLQNGLSGRLPGFYSQQRSGRPGGDGAAFFIRGVSSFTGANTPLIIVDDIEYNADQFSLIDPNEIESLTILKDASTTAVYGIKGANGVVVVTTRRGTMGAPKISVRSEYAIMEPTILPKYLDAYNSAKLYNQALVNDNLTPKFTNADLELFRNGKDPYGHPNVDWKDVLFRKYSSQLRNNLDISGGTDKIKYFVSLGYISQTGMLKDFSEEQGINSNYYNKRYNYRSNLDIKVTDNLDVRVDLYGNKNQVNEPSIRFNGKVNGDKNDALYEYSSFLSLAPFSYPIKNPDGTWGYSNWQRNEAGGGAYDANNIVARLSMDGYQRLHQDNMNFIASANHKLGFITPGLSAKALVSYASNYNYNRDLTRQQLPSYIYTPATPSAPESYQPRDPNVHTIARLATTYTPRFTFRDLTVQAMINYDRTFGAHHVYGLALANRNSKTTQNNNSTYNFIPINFQGFTGRLGYDFKQKYLVEFNAGYNGTDRFEASKRYGFFPAVSAGWNVAEEKFFQSTVPFINRFKLRGSYGVVGSDVIGNQFSYVYRQEYILNPARIYVGNFGFTPNTFSGLQEGTLSNTGVTWEKEKKLDIGLDFGLFNGKISGTIDFFNNNRYDILTTRGTVSQVFGQNLPPVNLGKTNNRGYEAELTYKDKIGKNFDYSVKATYSYAKNKVLYRDEPTFRYAYHQSTGQSIGQNLLYKWTGHFFTDQADIAKRPKTATPARPGDLEYEDINKDGVINEDDRGYFGYPNLPNTNYGFQINLTYKKLSLNVLFQGASNFTVNGYEESIRAFSANLSDVHLKAWTPELGDNAQYPALTLGRGASDPSNYNSTFWFRTGDYLRLRTAEISYALPKNWLQRMRIDAVRFYVNGNNLVTWSKVFKLYSLDPEFNPGTDRTNYPPQRIVNIGLSVTF